MLPKCVVAVLFACLAASLLGQDVDIVEDHENRRFQPGIVVRRADETHIAERIVIKSSDASSGISWSGLLESDADGDYRIAAEFVGELRVSLGGQVVIEQVAQEPTWTSSEPIRLAYDWHELRISLKPAANSSAVSLNVFWSGPGFRFEPIPARHFGHAETEQGDTHAARGRALVRVFRCQACHELGQRQMDGPLLPSPDLTNAYENLREPWLRQFLSANGESRTGSVRTAWHHLHGQFNETEVSDVIAYLSSLAKHSPETVTSAIGDAQEGRDLFFSLGCLACHKYQDLGNDNLFGGGDLTGVSSKRPAGFLRRWLQDPASVNSDHRMPQFQLSVKELSDLTSFLSRDAGGNASPKATVGPEEVRRGRQLVIDHQCASCHRIGALANAKKLTIGNSADWARSCLQSDGKSQPNYGLDEKADQQAIEQFAQGVSHTDSLALGRLLIEENNCFGCHARDSSPGILPVIQQVVQRHGRLVPELPRMRPPSLNSVGDKLHDLALRRSIARQDSKLRVWLSIRMPKFPLNGSQIDQIADYFVANDRVPDAAVTEVHDLLPKDALQGADRLVTSDGFGCTSCHAIGKVTPPVSTPLNQLAPSLSGLGKRIRKVWFDRWVRNPARIVPKMEMPSVQVGLPHLLQGNLDDQLTAVWQLLNTKGFQPPDPSPTRVAFRSGDMGEPAIVLTDVLRFGSRKLIKPFLIGLPNRHNVLLDLAEGRLAGWWTGDTANQRTQGKSWFWDAPLFDVQIAPDQPEFVLRRNGKQYEPQRVGQFVTEADAWTKSNRGVELAHRLRFGLSGSSELHTIHVTQRFIAVDGGWRRQIRASGLGSDDAIAVRSSGLESSSNSTNQAGLRWFVAQGDGIAALELEYISTADVNPAAPIPGNPPTSVARQLDVMPGFRVTQLPLRTDIMPTALAWKPSGELIVASLKGRVWEAADTDGDQLEDSLRIISDDLAAPYGLFADDGFVDVLNKYGLIRLHDENGDGETDRHEVVASGWGHTSDYHDWVVGLPKDATGDYFVAIPCQQDDRSEAAAYLRGKVLRLVPRAITDHDPRRFQLEIVTGGHRFPMGIALNQRGELFVTDNQGNYNPFNELNHIVKGSRYGFINKRERSPGFAPELTPPAIDIPHPWTRSVNGICFLETPPGIQEHLYGPFEGHLIGCEYDTRRLIRMSVEQVDGWFQGAAYPLAEQAANPEVGLQGPINCAIAPDGDIYVANIRDSGWGGANNTGSLVRIVPDLHNLPTGISEVKATGSGFRIEFTRPVGRSLAGDRERCSVSSYRRISTPAYGGDDVDRRTERITKVDVADNAMSVELELESLRTGFVYEFRLQRLIRGERQQFFPAEAYYTLRKRAKQ